MRSLFRALAALTLFTAGLYASHTAELDYTVENKTGKTIYCTCFSYVHKGDFRRWRWDKSPVVEIQNGATAIIDVDTLDNEQDRTAVYGYLGVFDNQQSADDAVIELVDERKLIDIDRLSELKGKKVTVEIEKYGHKEFFEYDFVPDTASTEKSSEIDFMVENRTGKPIIVCCFVYEKRGKGRWIPELEAKDDATVWRFDKTPLITLKPGEKKMLDIDTIISGRDRSYVRGYLAVFDGSEREEAEKATYEQLETRRKLNLGLLSTLKNKKVIVNVEKYGIMPNFIDYTTKPLSKIDFKKIHTR
ncbi:MAG: hypothetical protein WC365_04715 [Candidatus Babeliales bacterium]|jgi:hypothetical protein